MGRMAGKAEFQVNWRPFQLNAAAPKEGVEKMEMYKEKFGEARVKQMLPTMTKVFADEGLQYSMGGLTGNTLNSHRLIAAAQKEGKADAVVEELMRNYFCEEKFINDRAVLLRAAEKAGMSDAAKIIDDEQAYLKEVKEELRTYAAGVRGVPYFIVNGKVGLSGAQDPSTFEELFNELLSK
uniref:DSBA-like thioredoxin domain-containing protein n=1 Tax=Tetraselmis chuii TaxID=63592 RepID=A0A7S1SU86_9CHLO|mmetsp:Transcript_28473/g.50861  ORF Transcript_28473/g.50861 Transcript_28473/m.50861 type:complete len:181 (+) Transcript_28473:153-695(+)